MSQGTHSPDADALDMLVHDHCQVEQLYQQLQAADGTGRENQQKQLAEQIIAELSVHATVESSSCTRRRVTRWPRATTWRTRGSTSTRR